MTLWGGRRRFLILLVKYIHDVCQSWMPISASGSPEIEKCSIRPSG